MPYARVVGNPPPDADGIKLLSPRVQCWKLHNTVGCRPVTDLQIRHKRPFDTPLCGRLYSIVHHKLTSEYVPRIRRPASRIYKAVADSL